MITHSDGATPSKLMAGTCPLCGTDTSIARSAEPALGSLSLAEFETLVRNEWRRRLWRRWGKKCYRRPHSRSFIRGLIVLALKPESPVRNAVADELLWKEVSMLQAWGFNRRQIQAELLSFSQAIWHVLTHTDLDIERSHRLKDRIETKLLDTLSWPE